MIKLPEEKLFWYSIVLISVCLVLFLVILINWSLRGFRDIYVENQALAFVAFATDEAPLVSNVVMVQYSEPAGINLKLR